MHWGHHAGSAPAAGASVHRRAEHASDRQCTQCCQEARVSDDRQLSARLIRQPQGGGSARVASVNAHVLTTTGSLSALSAGARSVRCCRSRSESRTLKSRPRCSCRIAMLHSMMLARCRAHTVADRRPAGPSNYRTLEHQTSHPQTEGAAFADLREAPLRHSSACDIPVRAPADRARQRQSREQMVLAPARPYCTLLRLTTWPITGVSATDQLSMSAERGGLV